MLYDAAGKMNPITISLVPFCLGLKLSKKFNQTSPNSMFILCLKAIFCSFGKSMSGWPQGKNYLFCIYSEGCWTFTGAELRAKITCGSRNSEGRRTKIT